MWPRQIVSIHASMELTNPTQTQIRTNNKFKTLAKNVPQFDKRDRAAAP